LTGLAWASAPVVTALALWHVSENIRILGRSFPAVYFVTSTVTSLSVGKLGATTNHLIEWMVASCLCAGMAYLTMEKTSPRRIMPVTLMLSVSVLAGTVIQSLPSHQPLRDLTDCGKAYAYVRDSRSSQILSQNLTALLIGEKPVLVSDPFAYGQFVTHGIWPDRKVEQLVSQRYFGLIVLASDPAEMSLHGSTVWSRWFVDAVRENYQIKARFSCRDTAVMLEPQAPGAQTTAATHASGR
jgi:hypothetical protein